MRINGKEIGHNEHWTLGQMEYLEARIESLANTLEHKGYDVSYEKSRMSEAIYLTIEDETTSFRNHNYYGDNNPDEYTVWLSRFETWTDAKKHFMSEILPQLPEPGTAEKEFEMYLQQREAAQ